VELEVIICTHNRAALLERTLRFLDQAERPAGWNVSVLAVANACSDGTQALLEARSGDGRGLPLRWAAEARPGKSYALNHAIEVTTGDLVAFVDDDHRVDGRYLSEIGRAAEAYPEATIFCGRILPDWDGSEPVWVHDRGPYAIYPLPIPRYDQGAEPRPYGPEMSVPGGGNLALRRGVFDRVGGFSLELGPHGHDLGGGEDSDFVLRALAAGERLQYVPGVLQYHYVDLERLRLGYLIRKAYQRSRSVTQVRAAGATGVPLYLVRKLGAYFSAGLGSLYWPATRYYLVRMAAAMGEMRGYLGSSGTAPGG